MTATSASLARRLLGPGFAWAALAAAALPGPALVAANMQNTVGHPFRLTSADGRIVTDRDLIGGVTVVMFGFTNCPDVCPTTLAAASAGAARLGGRAREVRILFVSVDPGRDTPAILREYAQAFGPRVTALTGSAKALTDTARAFRANWSVTRGAGDAVEVRHTGLVYLFGRNGRLAKLLPPGTSRDRYAAELGRILDQARVP